jgi:3-phosphoshikimate 1-carboxyvinyltransferase
MSGGVRPDTVVVHPGALAGTVAAPGDKSLSHRVLLVAALCEGGADVSGVSPAEDVMSTAGALRSLGAQVTLAPTPDGDLAGTVSGPLRAGGPPLDCGNAGTGMRLLAGVAAGLEGETTLVGDPSLSRRPMDRIAVPLRRMGAEVTGQGDRVLPPLTIRGGHLHGIDYVSPVPSAQVKSCVLLAGLRASGTTTVRSPLPSRDHTERLLRHLGVEVDSVEEGDGSECVTVHPSPLRSRALHAAGDPSSAAFWLVAAAVAGTSVRVDGVCTNPGRTGFLEVLAALGASVARHDEREWSGEPVADLAVAADGLDGACEIDGRRVVDSIDELPILALAGAMSAGGLRVDDAAELRVKESDRIDTLAAAFGALGLDITVRPDGFTVPGGQRPAGGGTIDAHGDHRIAMTAAIAATISLRPVTITGFAAVPTSYPAFLRDLAHLGGRAEILDEETSR